MEPVTGLKDGETGEGAGPGEAVPWLHTVIITLLNITQAGWHISAPQSDLFVGQKPGEEMSPGGTGGHACISGH